MILHGLILDRASGDPLPNSPFHFSDSFPFLDFVESFFPSNHFLQRADVVTTNEAYPFSGATTVISSYGITIRISGV